MPTAFALQRLLHGSRAPGSTTCTFDIFFKNHLTSRGYSCRIAAASTQVDKEVLKLEIPKIHEGEYRFCLILWKHEPVTAAQLAKLCLEQLGWKRTTTYTIIKRLGERGILKNENGLVTSLVSKDEAQACEIDELVEKKFEGSLPTFIAAFTKRQDLSAHELDEVQQMIDRIRRVRIPTAIINPTSVGRISTTMRRPSLAPFKKVS